MIQLIPVIDLKNGLVVHAHKGQREFYQPIASQLSKNAELDSIIQGFLTIYPFQQFYIADLNAITQNGNQLSLLTALLIKYPTIEFWIDSGYQTHPCILSMYSNYRAVLGSESYSTAQLTDLKHFKHSFILSLDFSAQDQPLGANELFTSNHYWPNQVIIMTLAKVGTKSGVDIHKLKYYQTLSPNTTLIAAGGIREMSDVIELQQLGIHYGLCATALHCQTISAHDLAQFKI